MNIQCNKERAEELRARARDIKFAAEHAERRQDAADEFALAAKLFREADELDPPWKPSFKNSFDGIPYAEYHDAVNTMYKHCYDNDIPTVFVKVDAFTDENGDSMWYWYIQEKFYSKYLADKQQTK